MECMIVHDNYQSSMKIFILVVTLIFVQAQLPEELPPKFALLTVTHAREGQFDIILNYLKHYTETQCYEQLISQICIVWNNQQLPQQVGIMDRELYWRVPVYFYYTKNNSLNHRFRAPKQASSELFYSLDDDIIVDCHTLNATYLQYWKSKQSYPNRLVSNEVRSFGYLLNKKTQFYYQGHTYAQFFTIAQTGATFFPKHYLSLYYLQIEQIAKMRKLVDNITSCQDIFFMAIAQHFYPEMSPEYFHPLADYKNTDPRVGLSRKKGLVPLRTSCINFVTDTLGYNPMRLFNKDATKYANNWKFSNIDLIMQAKIRGLGKVEIQQSHQNEGKVNSLLNATAPSQFVYNGELLMNIGDLSEQKIQEIPLPQQLPKVKDHEAENSSKQVHQQKQQKEQKVQEVKEISILKNESFFTQYKFQLLVSFLIIVIIALILLIIRLWKVYNRLKNQNQRGSTIVEQEQYPMRTQQ